MKSKTDNAQISKIKNYVREKMYAIPLEVELMDEKKGTYYVQFKIRLGYWVNDDKFRIIDINFDENRISSIAILSDFDT